MVSAVFKANGHGHGDGWTHIHGTMSHWPVDREPLRFESSSGFRLSLYECLMLESVSRSQFVSEPSVPAQEQFQSGTFARNWGTSLSHISGEQIFGCLGLQRGLKYFYIIILYTSIPYYRESGVA